MKYIKTIENLYNKALKNGQATINGRMSLGWGKVGELEPKYEIYINETHVFLYHWGTLTLRYFKPWNEITHYYGQSNSDRDSINTLLYLLGNDERMRYFPSKDLFISQSDLGSGVVK